MIRTDRLKKILNRLSIYILVIFYASHYSNNTYADEAQFKRGLIAYQKEDYQQAINIWQTAARSKNVSSMYTLGVMYEQGNHVELNLATAKKWYLKAAKKGAPQAQHNLAKLLASQKMYKEAANWFKRAARINFTRSQYQLALLYEEGKGVEKNIEQAEKLLIKAGNDGLIAAQYKLVHMYMEGIGVEKNNESAFNWAKEASSSGDANSMYILGYMYHSGTGTVQNNDVAIMWLEDALKAGQPKAQQLLDLIANKESTVSSL